MENRGLYFFIALAGGTLLVLVLVLLSMPSTGVQSSVDSSYRMGRPSEEAHLFDFANRPIERTLLEDSQESRSNELLAPELRLAPGTSLAVQGTQKMTPQEAGIHPISHPPSIPDSYSPPEHPVVEATTSQDLSDLSSGPRFLGPGSSISSAAPSTKASKDPTDPSLARGKNPSVGKGDLQKSELDSEDLLVQAYRNSWISAEDLARKIADLLVSQEFETRHRGRDLMNKALDENLLMGLTDLQGRAPQVPIEEALLSWANESRIPWIAKALSRSSSQPRTLVLLSMVQRVVENLPESHKISSLEALRPSLQRLKSSSFRQQISQRASSILARLGPSPGSEENFSPSAEN